MSMSAKLRRGPMRAVTGAFVLQAGVGKLKADEETAKNLHGTASNTYSFLGNVDPKLFTKGLGVGEIALGGLVLAPFVSPVVAGAALVGFSGALLNLWWNTPGMHQEGSPIPTPAGTGVAKDVWMFGIGTGLLADGLLEPAHDKKLELTTTVHEKAQRRAKQGRRARKAAEKTAKAAAVAKVAKTAKDAAAKKAKDGRKSAKSAAKAARMKAASEAAHRQREAAAKAAAQAGQAAQAARAKANDARDAAKQLADQIVPVVVAKAAAARDGVKQTVDA